MFFSYSIYVWALVIAALSTGAAAKGKLRSTCREPTIFQNFDIPRIAGLWYIQSHHAHDLEYGCDCFTSNFELTGSNTFRISNCCQVTKVSNETQVCNIGIDNARIANAEKNEALFLYSRNGG